MIAEKLRSGKYFSIEAIVASKITYNLFLKLEGMRDATTDVIPIMFHNFERKKDQSFYLVQKTEKIFDYFGVQWWKITREHFNRVIGVSLTKPIFNGNIASQLFAPETNGERDEIIDAFLAMCRYFISPVKEDEVTE